MRTIAFLFGLLLICSSAAAQIDSLLLAAIKKTDTAAIAKRLNENIDVNAAGGEGDNALMWAAYYCDVPAIKILVRHGAVPPKEARMPIPGTENVCSCLPCVAAHRSKPDVMAYLADSLHLSLNETNGQPRRLDTGSETPMMYAVALGHTDIINYLLKKGVRADARTADSADTPFISALCAEQFNAFRLLLNTDECRRYYGRSIDSITKAVAWLEKMNTHRTAKTIAVRKLALHLRKISFGEESVGYAGGLQLLGMAFFNDGHTDSGEIYNRKAMALLERIGKQACPEYLACLTNLAFGYYNAAKYRYALDVLDSAMQLLPQIYPVEIYHKYTVHLSQADALPPRTPVVWPTAYTLCFYAATHSRMGQYALALRYFRQALAIAKEVGGEHLHYAYVATLMAAAYSGIGLYGEALPLYTKSLAIRKERGLKADYYSGNLLDMAYAFNQVGQYKEALPCFEEAAATWKKFFGEKHQYYAMCMDGEAYVYEHIGEYEKAVAKYKQAFAIYKDVFNESHPYCAFVLNNLANLYKSTGRYREALSCYHQALAIRKKSVTENHPDYAQTLSNLAALHTEGGNKDSGLLYYKNALWLIEKNLSKDHPYYAATLGGLARLCEKRNKPDSALLLYAQALVLNKKSLGDDFPGNVDLLNSLGNLHKQQGARAAAKDFTDACRLQLAVLNQTYASLSEGEKLAFVQKQSDVFTYLPSYLYGHTAGRQSLTHQLYQNELALKAMVAEDQKAVLNAIRQSGDSTVLSLYKQWQLNKALLGKVQLQQRRERTVSFDSLREATNLLEQELSRRSAVFQTQKQQRNIGVDDVAKNLKPAEAAVEFIRFRYYNRQWTDSVLYAALLLLPGDSVPRFIPLCEEKALQRALAIPKNMDTAYALQKTYRPENSRESDALYRLVWKPIRPYLRGVQTIYFAPAGLLHQVAFTALRDESSHCLLNRYALHRVMSTRAVAQPATVAAMPATASLWGNIQYNTIAKTKTAQKESLPLTTVSDFNLYTADTKGLRGGEFVPLPNTKKEVALLWQRFRRKGVKAMMYDGAAASEETFKSLDGNSPQVLHLATHGFFLPVVQKKNEGSPANAFTVQENPLFRSGLVLAGGNTAWKGKEPATHEDGILTAYEIAQLDLSNTDLMVLSACETALGDVKANEGVIGLQRAIKLAGVKQMIVSLWRVPDKETVGMMASFYKHWLSGLPPRDALRRGQLEMLKKGYPPFYWGGFVLIE